MIYKTDALARILALRPYAFTYQPEPQPSAADIERETDRLNALPRDQQMIIFCRAMGFDVFEYLKERAAFHAEAEQEIEWAEV